ncbi:LrgB family protein [Isachenkonia alkalipeptolytica]|uniref:LrgB family protein n=1 Tax=Isachenkonia alkalipeptolytica TaxID=2565777 RepID=A0AA44BDB0_9CLOT|nr:LrgB family protein [Isachenkonia alkalipeptolytica]NBG87747.1 LrgB family protein [Isachenkonia alkalipeptolytica]
MENLTSTPLFGILISLMAYQIGLVIFKRTKIQVLNPILTSALIIIGVLVMFDIPLENYEAGGDYILFLLGPATVVLAVPLYRQRELLVKYLFPILMGITVGAATSIVSVWFLSHALNIDQLAIISLLPKSVTTPIGFEIARQTGGNPALAVPAIVITGVTGAVVGPTVLRWFRIKEEVAQGVSMGTSAHGLGTAKAIEMGETQGAMSGLSIGVSGIITVVLVPLFLWIML